MKTEFCLLNEYGEVYDLVNPQEAFGTFELEVTVDIYRINCFYQRIHNDIIDLIQKGMILPSKLVYPQKKIQNTINYMGELIAENIGEMGIKELQTEINEQLNDVELINELMNNIMVSFMFEVHPSVVRTFKNGGL